MRNLVLAIRDQPLSEWRNGNALGIFSRRSHWRIPNQRAKRGFPTKNEAQASAEALSRQFPGDFAAYKCAFCPYYHVGKNR
jgi:hypothetical protein